MRETRKHFFSIDKILLKLDTHRAFMARAQPGQILE
jgi:hypothetical protein